MATLMVEFEGGRASRAPTLALRTWHRRDRDTISMKMNGTTGPNWNDVEERITFNMDTGEVIAREETIGKSKRWLRRNLNCEQTGRKTTNILTVLNYREWLAAENNPNPSSGNEWCNASGEKRELSHIHESRMQAGRPRTLHEQVTAGVKTGLRGLAPEGPREVKGGCSVCIGGARGSDCDYP